MKWFSYLMIFVLFSSLQAFQSFIRFEETLGRFRGTLRFEHPEPLGRYCDAHFKGLESCYQTDFFLGYLEKLWQEVAHIESLHDALME